MTLKEIMRRSSKNKSDAINEILIFLKNNHHEAYEKLGGSELEDETNFNRHPYVTKIGNVFKEINQRKT